RRAGGVRSPVARSMPIVTSLLVTLQGHAGYSQAFGGDVLLGNRATGSAPGAGGCPAGAARRARAQKKGHQLVARPLARGQMFAYSRPSTLRSTERRQCAISRERLQTGGEALAMATTERVAGAPSSTGAATSGDKI